MRSAGFSTVLIALSILIVSMAAPCSAAPEQSLDGQFQDDFAGIQSRLANIEDSQKDILARKQEIIEELDLLRVWVRHSGGKKTVVS